jgi:hypothetical protein
MRLLPWILSAVLMIVLAGMTYMFVIRGNVSDADDGRTAIMLSSGERNLVLKEMRAFLESVQQIVEAVPAGDLKSAEEAARRVGRVDLNDLPASLLRKLPAEVKALGLDTHGKFYKLANAIHDGMEREKILPMLADIMTICVGCHASYRIDLEKGGM